MMVNERIVLNVGGIKYETLRSTLTAHPNTFLGKLFDSCNQSLLTASSGGEYFIDRDGHAFHYILQFYRNGQVTFKNNDANVSREQLETELAYFGLPRLAPPNADDWSRFDETALAESVDDFVEMLLDALRLVKANYRKKLTVVFPGRDIENFSVRPILDPLVQRVKPFALNGFNFLHYFGTEIEQHMCKNVTKLKWQLKHQKLSSDDQFELHLELSPEFDRKRVLQKSCLK